MKRTLLMALATVVVSVPAWAENQATQATGEGPQNYAGYANIEQAQQAAQQDLGNLQAQMRMGTLNQQSMMQSNAAFHSVQIQPGSLVPTNPIHPILPNPIHGPIKGVPIDPITPTLAQLQQELALVNTQIQQLQTQMAKNPCNNVPLGTDLQSLPQGCTLESLMAYKMEVSLMVVLQLRAKELTNEINALEQKPNPPPRVCPAWGCGPAPIRPPIGPIPVTPVSSTLAQLQQQLAQANAAIAKLQAQMAQNPCNGANSSSGCSMTARMVYDMQKVLLAAEQATAAKLTQEITTLEQNPKLPPRVCPAWGCGPAPIRTLPITVDPFQPAPTNPFPSDPGKRNTY